VVAASLPINRYIYIIDVSKSQRYVFENDKRSPSYFESLEPNQYKFNIFMPIFSGTQLGMSGSVGILADPHGLTGVIPNWSEKIK
jgi:hypothetical protein